MEVLCKFYFYWKLNNSDIVEITIIWILLRDMGLNSVYVTISCMVLGKSLGTLESRVSRIWKVGSDDIYFNHKDHED